MATASVPNGNFVNGTPADADEVDANFAALVSFLNGSVVHRDGSKAMTAAFDAGSQKIVNLTAGTAAGDAVNKTQLDLKSDVSTVSALPIGKMFVASASGTDQSGITSVTDVTGVTGSFTAVASRLYRTTVYVNVQKTTAGRIDVSITNSGGALLVQRSVTLADGDFASISFPYFESGISGSTTRKLRIYADTGSVTVVNSFGRQASIVVEDIGPA